MHDPFKMVFINLISSLLLLLGIFVFKFVYPKKPIYPIVIVILFSLLPLTSLLRVGTYESGDFNIHLYRIMSFYDSLREGIFLPSWAAELNATYGNPLFIFNYCFSYYIISLFHFFGISFIESMKLYLALTFVISGIGMFLFIKKLTNNNIAAVSASLFYLYNPYHLIDVHFRATLGESSVFAFAPYIFFFIIIYYQKKTLLSLFGIGIFTTITFLSHPLLGLTIIAIIAPFTLYISYIKKDITSLFKIYFLLFLGMLGAIYLLVPFILYAPYMYPNPSSTLQFNPVMQLFYAPWRYGLLFQGPYGELALMIGYSQIFIIVILIYLLLKKRTFKKDKYHIIFWITFFFIFFFSMLPVSRFIWNFFPLLWMLIPTGRLLLPTALCTSVLAGYLALHLKEKQLFIVTLLFLTVFSTILNWGHRRVIPEIGDKQLRQGVWKSTVNESITAYFLNNKWADKNNFWFSELPNNHLDILQGNGDVKEIERTSIKHTYLLNAVTKVTIQENTLFFPGWELKANNNPISIFPGKRGVINAVIPKGEYYVELQYTDIPLYKNTKLLSISIVILLLSTFIVLLVKEILKNKLFFLSNPKHFSRNS